MNREGKVLLRLTIDERGRMTELEVVKGAAFGLTEAAVEAIRKSTFIPAREGGIAVKAKAPLTVRFELTR
jgi:periplasmic protein TonB